MIATAGDGECCEECTKDEALSGDGQRTLSILGRASNIARGPESTRPLDYECLIMI